MADLQPISILTAARDNRCEDIRRVVATGVPADVANEFGQTAIHIAALWGNVEAILTLLQLGANPGVANSRGSTPLHFAASAKKKALETCQALLDGGADPDAVDMMGRQPYEMADADDVRTLLGGPDSRIFEFASSGNAAALRELLASGSSQQGGGDEDGPERISVRVVDSEGRTPLGLAIEAESLETVKVLLEHDPAVKNFPDMSGDTPLHAAVEVGNLDILKYLLSLKPEVNVQNMNTSEYAQGNWMLHGETLEPFDKSPLHIAVEAGDIAAVEVLLEVPGIDVNALDFDKCSALHYALQDDDVRLVRLLLSKGADVNQPNPDFKSALHLAASRGKPELLPLLLQHGADIGVVGSDGVTPLHLAAQRGATDKVVALLAAGADVAASNKQGNTALHLAAVNGHIGVVQALLQAGAPVGAVNREGRKAEDSAKTEEIRRLFAPATGQ